MTHTKKGRAGVWTFKLQKGRRKGRYTWDWWKEREGRVLGIWKEGARKRQRGWGWLHYLSIWYTGGSILAAGRGPASSARCSWALPIAKGWPRASPVAQWLRIRLPMQGTRVRALVWEDPTCRGATKPVRHNYRACALEPVHHNYWACALEPPSHNYWARVLQLLKPMLLKPVLCNKRSHRKEKPAHRNEE